MQVPIDWWHWQQNAGDQNFDADELKILWVQNFDLWDDHIEIMKIGTHESNTLLYTTTI